MQTLKKSLSQGLSKAVMVAAFVGAIVGNGYVLTAQTRVAPSSGRDGEPQVQVAAKQPVVVSKPEAVTYKLSAEASKAYLDIEKAKDDLRKQFVELERTQWAIRLGAGIPLDRMAKPNGAVVEFPPLETPKPSPTP